MESITARTGEAHVTSTQFRAIMESLIGSGSYIADMYEQLEPELTVNNTVKIKSGILVHHGHIMRVPPNTYDPVTYLNGSQGMKRIDLVVARYTKEADTEKTEWVVIQGTPDATNPAVPGHTEGNMQDGDLTDDCPVFELHFDGINVTEVKKLVPVIGNVNGLGSDISGVKTNVSNILKKVGTGDIQGYFPTYSPEGHNAGLAFKTYGNASIPSLAIDGNFYDLLPNNTGKTNYKITNAYVSIVDGVWRLTLVVYVDGKLYAKYINLT